MFGNHTTRGAFIVNLVLGGCAAHRTQKFNYLKACVREELSTMNCWAGVDAPAPGSSPPATVDNTQRVLTAPKPRSSPELTGVDSANGAHRTKAAGFALIRSDHFDATIRNSK